MTDNNHRPNINQIESNVLAQLPTEDVVFSGGYGFLLRNWIRSQAQAGQTETTILQQIKCFKQNMILHANTPN